MVQPLQVFQRPWLTAWKIFVTLYAHPPLGATSFLFVRRWVAQAEMLAEFFRAGWKVFVAVKKYAKNQ